VRCFSLHEALARGEAPDRAAINAARPVGVVCGACTSMGSSKLPGSRLESPHQRMRRAGAERHYNGEL